MRGRWGMLGRGAMVAASAALLSLASGGAATAQLTLLPATTDVQFQPGPQFEGGVNFTDTIPSPGGSETATTQGESEAEATATITDSGSPNSGGVVSVYYDYFFGVTGPTNTVKIVMSGLFLYSGTIGPLPHSGYGVLATGTIQTLGFPAGSLADVEYDYSARNDGPPPSGPPLPPSSPYTKDAAISTATAYEILIYVEASLGGSGSITATFDPVISIDPSTPDASAYQFYFSPGIGNPAVSPPPATVIPEPSTWALLLSGFGVIALWRWRRASAIA
jgi:hypothetical protein